MTEIEAQLMKEITTRLWAFKPIIPSIDVASDRVLAKNVTTAAVALSSLLTDDEEENDNHRSGAVVDILNCLFPLTMEPPADWWTTPLGGACARSLGNEHATAWTHSVTGGFLGVTKGTVSKLLERGKLDRHPDGGIVPASVWVYRDQRDLRKAAQ